jgi:hypothetical protein
MGNILCCCFSNDNKCYNCERIYGDYGLNYVCYIIGKGKYNGKYICFDCIYEKMKKAEDDNKYKTFEEKK